MGATFLMVFFYCAALIQADVPSSANYPGSVIAHQLETTWQNQFHQPLSYVAGPRWLAGNVAFYSKNHPTVYIDWDKHISTWIDETALRKSGAIFLWDPRESRQTPFSVIHARFPHLQKPVILQFTWLRNNKLEPVDIIMAFLPPEKWISVAR